MTVIFVQFINLAHEVTHLTTGVINNILGKVFSISLNNRLEKFITSNNFIDDTQRTYDTLGDICPIFERPELCFKAAVTILVW